MKTNFTAIPDDPALRLHWPTGNHHLLDRPELFFARTRANPDYGKPGWTRDCGRRFHRGVDIAPVRPIATGRTTRVMFSDCASGAEYESEEPVWDVHEDVFAVCDGLVVEVQEDPAKSTLGAHVVLKHAWPTPGGTFFSLYAHLAVLHVSIHNRIQAGQRIGIMGQTSSSADARNWMAIAPHLHLEFHDAHGNPYDPVLMLQRYVRTSSATLSM